MIEIIIYGYLKYVVLQIVPYAYKNKETQISRLICADNFFLFNHKKKIFKMDLTVVAKKHTHFTNNNKNNLVLTNNSNNIIG